MFVGLDPYQFWVYWNISDIVDFPGSFSPNDSARMAGSTAVVALICDRRKLYVAWLGDSEAALAKAGYGMRLVVPHKPSNPSELTRIEGLGGTVDDVQGVYRINGNLAVSRSIGECIRVAD